MSIKIILILLGLSLAYTISPIVIVLIGYEVAYLSGCAFVGAAFECPSVPWLSPIVNTMISVRVYGLITIPTGVALSGIFVVALIILLIYRAFR